jgi:hypothetical protein
MNATDFELPEGFVWARRLVIRCERCKVEKDCSIDTTVDRYVSAHLTFIEDHQSCTQDRGGALANTMTIREKVIVDLVAAYLIDPASSVDRVSNRLQEIIEFADEVIARMHVTP